YDAFMSYEREHSDKVKGITGFLEEESGFNCCIHDRDFVSGRRIMDEIDRCLDASRRVLCFLSPTFIKSDYCMLEFKQTHEEDLKRGKKRLVAIMLEPVTEFDEKNVVVQKYISTFTYLDIKDPDF
ncbi:hypothetical protein CAPTEDRAFT_30552, partial [Capitella teleta]